jgi:hypothetical protein
MTKRLLWACFASAVARLPQGPVIEVLVALRRCAPLWLMQLSGLLREGELEHLQRQVQ